ncbi:MAG: hypothetical protein LUQ29_08745, partial [Methylococcaceae bacterium]|nr:hypothetical protein [Methylococcaceae bacterium]
MLCPWRHFASRLLPGELLFGLAKRPDAKRLHLVVHKFLLRVDMSCALGQRHCEALWNHTGRYG